MKKYYNIYHIMGIVLITFYVSACYSQIGQLSESKIISWTLPIYALIIFSFLFWLGIQAGKDD